MHVDYHGQKIMDKMVQNYADLFHLKFLTLDVKWAFYAFWHACYISLVASFSTLLGDFL